MQYKDISEILNIKLERIEEVLNDKNNYYYSYPIRKKSGGKRYIDAPHGILKEWQTRATKEFLYNFGPHPIAYGFARNKSPILAAKEHVNKDILLAMDIKNFSNSIRKEHLLGLFSYLNSLGDLWKRYPRDTKRTEPLIELFTFKGMVPQGAPSSPALSNIYMLRADKLLSELAKRNNAVVTRLKLIKKSSLAIW